MAVLRSSQGGMYHFCRNLQKPVLIFVVSNVEKDPLWTKHLHGFRVGMPICPWHLAHTYTWHHPHRRFPASSSGSIALTPRHAPRLMQVSLLRRSCNGETCIGFGTVSPDGRKTKITLSAHGVFVTSQTHCCKAPASSGGSMAWKAR